MCLNDYLERLVTSAHYPITFASHVPRPLNRWLVRAVIHEPAAARDAKPCLDESARILMPFEAQSLPVEERESQWRYYASTSYTVFQDPCAPSDVFTRGEDKLLYALCNIYAEKSSEVLLNAVTYQASPMRVWINGELALSASHDFVTKDALLLVHLKEGNNLVLVEMPLRIRFRLNEHGLTLKLQPLDRMLAGRETYPFFDPDRLEVLRNSLGIYPEKVMAEAGSKLEYVVLTRHIGGPPPGKITVSLETLQGVTVSSIETDCGRSGAIGLPAGFAGVLRLTARNADGSRISPPVHLFSGDWEQESGRLLESASRRPDIDSGVIASMRGLIGMPEMFQESNQYIGWEAVDTLLRMWGELCAYPDRPEGTGVSGYAEIFPSGYAVHRPRQVGDDDLVCRVHLPQGFRRDRDYPLVVFFADRFGRYYPMELPWIRDLTLENAIVLDLNGIGRLNYVDDLEVLRAISDTVSSLPVDRGRIYAIGYCTGAMKAFRLAMAVPDLFAGIVNMGGEVRLSVNQPEYEWLENLGDTSVISLCNIEDWFFNFSRVKASLERLDRLKLELYTGFTHTELHALHDSRKLLRELAASTRERYPRAVKFRVLEPGYNKSHWVVAEPSVVTMEKPCIAAELHSRSEIRVTMEHMDGFLLLLSREDMDLAGLIRIVVNGWAAAVAVDSYTRVSVRVSGESFYVTAEPLSEFQFRQCYDRIRADESLLGIKRVYLNPCKVIRPAVRSGFTRKLAYLLQNPIRSRYLFYKYDSAAEEEYRPEEPGFGNSIWIIDSRSMSAAQQRLAEATGLTLGPDRFGWQGEVWEGDYFALVSLPDPYHPEGLLLMALYNSESVEAEMIRLMNEFDTNRLFFRVAVLFHQGRYRTLAGREPAALAPGGRS
jgi:dienelactone hydrolase